MQGKEWVQAMAGFEVPERFYHLAPAMLTKDEIKLIGLVGKEELSHHEFSQIIKSDFNVNAEAFLLACYRRAVIRKTEKDGILCYGITDFYTRMSYFAQYEPEKWYGIPAADRKELDEWCLAEYVERIKDTVVKKINGETVSLHNSHLMTLKEAQAMIDHLEQVIYLQPCNCKAIALNCEKPRNVCIQFGCGMNSPADRGWGEKITKEKAKEILAQANKSGLMHTGEDEALCNCDGCCCYPFRAAEKLGSKGKWPDSGYQVDWDPDRCSHCGKCTRMCNFGAFYMTADKKVKFDKARCWGCSICAENCPKGAIGLSK